VNSTSYIVRARKEVILSAGSIKDPQILELSVIGRKEILEKLGVDIRVSLLASVRMFRSTRLQVCATLSTSNLTNPFY